MVIGVLTYNLSTEEGIKGRFELREPNTYELFESSDWFVDNEAAALDTLNTFISYCQSEGYYVKNQDTFWI